MAHRKPRPRQVAACRQFAALPLGIQDGQRQVMLITSRQTGRWIIPKGWPEPGLQPHEVAAKEAFEEAGLVGEIAAEPIATFVYDKRMAKGRVLACDVEVYPLTVSRQLDSWPEQQQRVTRWLSFAEAAMAVEEAGLISLLLRLAAEEA